MVELRMVFDMVEFGERRESRAYCTLVCFFFFSSRRRHTRLQGDWSSDVCSSDLFASGSPSRNFGPLSYRYGWSLGPLPYTLSKSNAGVRKSVNAFGSLC